MDRLENLFFEQGYGKIPSNLPEFNFYCHREVQGINVLHVIDYRQGLYISDDQYTHLKERIGMFFRDRGEQEIHVMTLVLCDDTEKARKLCENDRFCWIIDTREYRLLIHETQTADFYGWKEILEEYLFALIRESVEAAEPAGKSEKADYPRNVSWVNAALVAVNVIIFLICTFTGDLLYNKGAFNVARFGRESGTACLQVCFCIGMWSTFSAISLSSIMLERLWHANWGRFLIRRFTCFPGLREIFFQSGMNCLQMPM